MHDTLYCCAYLLKPWRISDLRRLLASKPKNYDKKSESFLNARTALRTTRATFETTNIEYERTLGYGGLGLDAKLAHRNRDGQHLRHVFVKAPLKPESTSAQRSHRREHAWYKVSSRLSKHEARSKSPAY